MKFLKTNRSDAPPFRGEALCVGALLLLAFLVRWIPALLPHFWHDEIYTISLIHYSFSRILSITATDSHPPLFYWWVKLLAAAGYRLGGPFATLAWLRLASILPGWLACLLAWGLARRHWGSRAALWTLALFAVSPALVYYSVELRNYALVHCLMLAGMIGFLGAADPRRSWRGGVPLFLAAMLAAFYVHSLTSLYLATFGLLYLAEIVIQRGWRGVLLRRGAVMAVLILAACLPWLRVMHYQAGLMNITSWLGWAAWPDLPATFFWYLPFGPLDLNQVSAFGSGFAMGLTCAGFAWLGEAAWRCRATHLSATIAAPLQAASPAPSKRLIAYLFALTVIPNVIEFFLSHYHIAKVFLGMRYSLMAAPFFTLLLAFLLVRIPSRFWRRAALAATLALLAALCRFEMRQRIAWMDEIKRIADAGDPALLKPESRVYWASPTALPWLERCGGLRLASFEDALAGGPSAIPGNCYILDHSCFKLNFGFSQIRLLEYILKRHKVATLDLPDSLKGFYPNVWRLRPEKLPRVAADLTSATRALTARRAAIPGGQVVLADDPAFLRATGWSCVTYDDSFLPQSWTEGPHQSLTWNGPERPGRYRLQARFYRANPFPEKTVTTRYRLPGQPWKERVDGLGWVMLEAEVTTTRPRQPLALELETPTWRPSERVPGSNDPRPIGMLFTGVELRPIR